MGSAHFADDFPKPWRLKRLLGLPGSRWSHRVETPGPWRMAWNRFPIVCFAGKTGTEFQLLFQRQNWHGIPIVCFNGKTGTFSTTLQQRVFKKKLWHRHPKI
jgi:hypothetical protein